jgi:hypothetical protein
LGAQQGAGKVWPFPQTMRHRVSVLKQSFAVIRVLFDFRVARNTKIGFAYLLTREKRLVQRTKLNAFSKVAATEEN